MKVESMFIQMLEGLHATEAEVLIKAVNKTLHKKYRITLAVVKEAFPMLSGAVGLEKIKILQHDCQPEAAEDRTLPYTSFIVCYLD